MLSSLILFSTAIRKNDLTFKRALNFQISLWRTKRSWLGGKVKIKRDTRKKTRTIRRQINLSELEERCMKSRIVRRDYMHWSYNSKSWRERNTENHWIPKNTKFRTESLWIETRENVYKRNIPHLNQMQLLPNLKETSSLRKIKTWGNKFSIVHMSAIMAPPPFWYRPYLLQTTWWFHFHNAIVSSRKCYSRIEQVLQIRITIQKNESLEIIG